MVKASTCRTKSLHCLSPKGNITKSDTLFLAPYNTIVDNTIRASTATIDDGIRIFTNETLTLNHFCIQYPNLTFFDALEFS